MLLMKETRTLFFRTKKVNNDETLMLLLEDIRQLHAYRYIRSRYLI